MRMSSPVMPRWTSQSAAQRADSDLSVSPISTCLTSLVIRGSARPAACAALAASSMTWDRSLMSTAARRAITASASRPISAFLGSAQYGSGMRSILRRLRRLATIRASRPRSRRRSTVCSAARSSARSSSTLAVRRYRSCGPSPVTRKTSEPLLQHKKRWPRPCGLAWS